MGEVTHAQVAEWRKAIGREQAEKERLDPLALRRFAQAIDCEGPSALGHCAFFLPSPDDADIGPDGHPRRGGFLPDISLERRMFAASEIAFHHPLRTDADAVQTSRIADVTHKQGESGDLVFATVEKRIEQTGALCLIETQTYVYRDPGAPVTLPLCSDDRAMHGWTPQEVNLFRFSAATGNAHRIHYDLPYARDVEGYPALLVHGPFTAAKLADLAAQDGKLASFAFRASAPLFCGQPVRLEKSGDGQYDAIRCDGVTAMTAKATFR